jgi:putative membrane protein
MDFSRYLITLPDFAIYFASAVILLAIFVTIYTLLTPQHEWTLIRNGNTAASMSLGGALIGFVLPLGSVIVSSLSLVDMLVWGGVALIVQLLVFSVLRLLLPQLPARITNNETAAGSISAAFSVGIGVLNAACMTY